MRRSESLAGKLKAKLTELEIWRQLMPGNDPVELLIDYDPVRVSGRITRTGPDVASPIWERLRAHFSSANDVKFTGRTADMPWPRVLEAIREFGGRSVQQSLNFRFRPTGEAIARVTTFIRELKEARQKRSKLTLEITSEEIEKSSSRRVSQSGG
ncbi:hypothetical protein ACRAVF_15815 [Bradyrhizobium oligotrophicum S58]